MAWLPWKRVFHDGSNFYVARGCYRLLYVLVIEMPLNIRCYWVKIIAKNLLQWTRETCFSKIFPEILKYKGWYEQIYAAKLNYKGGEGNADIIAGIWNAFEQNASQTKMGEGRFGCRIREIWD